MKVLLYQGPDLVDQPVRTAGQTSLFPTPARIEDRVLAAVTEAYDVTLAELVSPSRKPHFVWPRQLAMALLRELSPYSLEFIGHLFGHRDHSTVIYAVRRVEKRSDLAGDHPGEYQALRRQLLKA